MSKPGEPPGRWRTFFFLVVGTLLVVVLLTLAVFIRLRLRVREVGRRLVSEYQTLSTARWPRPSHVDAPTPGSLAQALEPVLPELLLFRASQSQLESRELASCLADLQNHRPVSKLSSVCRDSLTQRRGLLHRVLRTTRTEEGGLPEALRPWSSPSEAWEGLEALFHLAALETRLQAEARQAEAAVDTCLDALALARDLGRGGGWRGAAVSTQAVDGMFEACHTALSRASPPRLLAAGVSLRHLREGLGVLSSTLREESVSTALTDFCVLLEPGERIRLPAAFRGCSDRDPCCDPTASDTEAWLRPYTFLRQHTHDSQLAALVDAPTPERILGLEALERRRSSVWDAYARTGWEPGSSLADQVERQRTQLDLLLALAWVRSWRAEHDTWPSALPELYPEHAVPPSTELKLRLGGKGTLDIFAKGTALHATVSP